MSALTDSIDESVASLRQAFIKAQGDFFSVYGRYWQGHVTHEVLPEDGVGKPINDLDRKPDSEPFGWRGFGVGLPPNLRASLRVNNYDGPDGKGFFVEIFLKEQGRTMSKVVYFGPLESQTTAWVEVTDSGEGVLTL